VMKVITLPFSCFFLPLSFSRKKLQTPSLTVRAFFSRTPTGLERDCIFKDFNAVS